MQWVKIDRLIRVQNQGVYTDWKQQISDDCSKQCVYCSINEGLWGGIDHYHIDHFRPKSKFGHLENTITNLYHACPICNRFKSDDWPDEPNDLNLKCYPDPSDHDYKDLFELDTKNYLLVGRYTSSAYLVNRLYLNRPQLVYERREHLLKIKAEALVSEAKKLLELSEDITLIKKLSLLLSDLIQHLQTRSNIPPYKLIEIRKSGQ